MDLSQIKKRRKELGMTQWELAEKVGVSETTIRKWEKGVGSPNKENEKRLEEVLNGRTTES